MRSVPQTTTKALFERVRYAINQAEKMDRHHALAALSELEARMDALRLMQDDKLIAAARDLVDAVKSSSDAVSNDLGNAMARMEDILDRRLGA